MNAPVACETSAEALKAKVDTDLERLLPEARRGLNSPHDTVATTARMGNLLNRTYRRRDGEHKANVSGRLPSGRGFLESFGRDKNSVIQAQEQCHGHLLPAVLVGSLAAGAFFSVDEKTSSLAGQSFLVMSVASVCLEFASSFISVHALVYYSTRGGEVHYRAFDTDVTFAGFFFHWGAWAFLASMPLRAIMTIGTGLWATHAIIGMVTCTIVGLTVWLRSCTAAFGEAYLLELAAEGAPDDFKTDLVPGISVPTVRARYTPLDTCKFLAGMSVWLICPAIVVVGSVLYVAYGAHK